MDFLLDVATAEYLQVGNNQFYLLYKIGETRWFLYITLLIVLKLSPYNSDISFVLSNYITYQLSHFTSIQRYF